MGGRGGKGGGGVVMAGQTTPTCPWLPFADESFCQLPSDATLAPPGHWRNEGNWLSVKPRCHIYISFLATAGSSATGVVEAVGVRACPSEAWGR